MYQAELKGKLSSRQETSEDLLTSNVFSFFKYARREVFLKAFLELMGIRCTPTELVNAQFLFWPTYDDRTEPDVVILAGEHYLLIEAKLFAGFGKEGEGRKSQIEREIEAGLNEARSLNMTFHFLALTAHYHLPGDFFKTFPVEIEKKIKWLNWQAVAGLLLEILEEENTAVSDREFARDLYDLLDRKNLRGFLPFQRIKARTAPPPPRIFFSAETAVFRGSFLGFRQALEPRDGIAERPESIFFQGKQK